MVCAAGLLTHGYIVAAESQRVETIENAADQSSVSTASSATADNSKVLGLWAKVRNFVKELLKAKQERMVPVVRPSQKVVHGVTFPQLIAASESFEKNIGRFPTKANRIAVIAGTDTTKQEMIAKQANGARIIMHGGLQNLVASFLSHKKADGSEIEKKFYKGMRSFAFIKRLLIKRPLMFMTGADTYLLRNGAQGNDGFEAIGTTEEKSPLRLADYLSYDEMQIAALLGVVTPTYFINNGARMNSGIPGTAGSYQEQGVYAGLVGARFEKPGLMEWQHMMVTKEQNTKEHGYGAGNKSNAMLNMWADFYHDTFATFDEAAADKTGRYIQLNPTTYFDAVIYKKRMRMVIEPFLVDANDRGVQDNQKVYCHVVGLGLGVWQQSPVQGKLMLEVYAEIIASRSLPAIADIDFSWFPAAYTTCGGVGDRGVITTHGNSITIHFSKRNPSDRLVGVDAKKLLVAMYAWDGNAYPGNEYWAGMLTASGDPAAACCSTIPELQNPMINHALLTNKPLVS